MLVGSRLAVLNWVGQRPSVHITPVRADQAPFAHSMFMEIAAEHSLAFQFDATCQGNFPQDCPGPNKSNADDFSHGRGPRPQLPLFCALDDLCGPRVLHEQRATWATHFFGLRRLLRPDVFWLRWSKAVANRRRWHWVTTSAPFENITQDLRRALDKEKNLLRHAALMPLSRSMSQPTHNKCTWARDLCILFMETSCFVNSCVAKHLRAQNVSSRAGLLKA